MILVAANARNYDVHENVTYHSDKPSGVEHRV